MNDAMYPRRIQEEINIYNRRKMDMRDVIKVKVTHILVSSGRVMYFILIQLGTLWKFAFSLGYECIVTVFNTSPDI